MDFNNAEQMAEVQFLVSQLQIVLGQDNDARKGAEEHLKKIKEGEPDKYACYLTAVIMEPQAGQDIKALAAVVLRRSLGTVLDNTEKKDTLWEALSPAAKDFLKTNLLNSIRVIDQKDLIHKVSNLLVEVQGGMYEQNDAHEIWQDLLNLIFEFVNSTNNLHVDSALQMFNGLFTYIIDHLNKFKNDLLGIFRKTLNHQSLEIRLAAL